MTLFDDLIGHATLARLLTSFLAHPAPAYLFVGAPHLGKRAFAERFIKGLLEASRPPVVPLRKGDIGSHPDFIVLDLLDGKKQISIEQVRELLERVSLRPLIAPRVVAYLPHADRLNESGMNALLKVLEEPPAGAVFVFVAEDASRFPATVLSRVIKLPFEIVPKSVIEAGLIHRGFSLEDAQSRAAASRGRPGLALDPPEKTVREEFFAAFLNAKKLGTRFRLIDELTKRCESSENAEEEWRHVLLFGNLSKKADASHVVCALGMLQALRLIGSPISPRVALEAAAVRMGSRDVLREARQLMPTHLPRTIPLLFADLV